MDPQSHRQERQPEGSGPTVRTSTGPGKWPPHHILRQATLGVSRLDRSRCGAPTYQGQTREQDWTATGNHPKAWFTPFLADFRFPVEHRQRILAGDWSSWHDRLPCRQPYPTNRKLRPQGARERQGPGRYRPAMRSGGRGQSTQAPPPLPSLTLAAVPGGLGAQTQVTLLGRAGGACGSLRRVTLVTSRLGVISREIALQRASGEGMRV